MLASTPTNILNHKTAKNGIPSDSAKDGNALDRDIRVTAQAIAETAINALRGIPKSQREQEEKSSAFVDVEGTASDARASGAVQQRAR